MAESPDAGKAAYGVLRLASIAENTTPDLEQVKELAMKTARETGQVIAVFRIIGYAAPPDGPARWTVSADDLPGGRNDWSWDKPGEMASSQQTRERDAHRQALPAPPAPPPTPPIPAASLHAVERTAAANVEEEMSAEETVPWADEENRAKPKYPTVRGVMLPKYADVTTTSGPSGPALPETVREAEDESQRIGGQLGKTVTAWTGLPFTQVNQATMEAVVKILCAWKSK